MARTADQRNIVIIYTQGTTGTWQGRAVEVQQDGTLVLGTADTNTGELSAIQAELRQPNASGGSTPENSARYSTAEVHSEVFVPRSAWQA